MSEPFLVGEVARLDLAATDLAGAAVDPGALLLKVKAPGGAVATYSYGADAELVRDSLGHYHAAIPLPVAGQWAYRWDLVAPNAGAAEGVISVQKSRVI